MHLIVALLAAFLFQTDAASRCMDPLLDYESVITACNEAIAVSPNDPLLLSSRAYAYLQTGQYIPAITDYNQWIALEPTSQIAFHNRGVTYANMGMTTEARADYDRALQIDPMYVDAYINRALLSRFGGDPAAAVPDLTQAITIDPNAVPAYIERGFAYIDLNDYGAALADLDAAIALDPLAGGAYMGRALIALNQRDYTRAEAEYTHALELGSINPIDALFGRAFARMQLGNFTGALDDYNIVMAFDPGNINVRVNRIEAYMMMANFQRVTQECDDIVALNTGYTAYCFMHLARVGERTGDFARTVVNATDYARLLREYGFLNETQVLNADQPTSVDVVVTNGFTVVYRIAATTDIQVLAERLPNNGSDPILVLVDASGQAIAFSDNESGRTDGAARISYNVPMPGEYYLLVAYAVQIGDGVRLTVQ